MSVSNSYVEVEEFLEGFSNTVWVGVSGFWGLLSYNMEWIFFSGDGGSGLWGPFTSPVMPTRLIAVASTQSRARGVRGPLRAGRSPTLIGRRLRGEDIVIRS